MTGGRALSEPPDRFVGWDEFLTSGHTGEQTGGTSQSLDPPSTPPRGTPLPTAAGRLISFPGAGPWGRGSHDARTRDRRRAAGPDPEERGRRRGPGARLRAEAGPGRLAHVR